MRGLRSCSTSCAILVFFIAASHAQRVELYRENPHYLALEGVPVFPLGATHQHSWTPVSRPQVNLLQDLDRLARIVEEIASAHVRGFVRCLPYDPLNHLHDGDVERVLQPWKRLEDGLFDLEEFEPEWEERLTSFLEAALQREVIVSLEVWDDWSVTRGAGGASDPGPGAAWNGHPFNPDNNVNYGRQVLSSTTDACDAPFYTTIPSRGNIPRVLRLQQLYVDRLIELARPFPNVLFNLSNETRASLEWSRYWAEYLAARLPEDRFIGEMPSTNRRDGGGECEHALNPLTLIGDSRYGYVDIAQAVSQHEFGSDPLRQALEGGARIRSYYLKMEQTGQVKPLVVSKDYTRGPEGGAVVFWSRFVAGAAAARFHRPGRDNVEVSEFQYETLRRLAQFVATVPFWSMKPDPAVVLRLPAQAAGANTLALKGEHYVVQLLGAEGGGDLELRLEPGSYSFRWVDPEARKGEVQRLDSEGDLRVDPPGRVILEVPPHPHLILQIRRLGGS